MEKTVRRMLEWYGQPMVLTQDGKETPVVGLLQPRMGTNLSQTRRSVTPLGEKRRGVWRYYGPAHPCPRVGDRLALGKKYYTVTLGHAVWGDQAPLYAWAICIEEGVEESWENNG